MNFVWPITALYAVPPALIANFTIGRKATHKKMVAAKEKDDDKPSKKKPFWQSVTVGALHCGKWLHTGRYNCRDFVAIHYVDHRTDKLVNAWIVDYFFCFCTGHRISVLFYKANEKPLTEKSIYCSRKGRYALPHILAGGYVWRSSYRYIFNFQTQAGSQYNYVLVCNAVCNDAWLSHSFPRKLVADKERY